MKENIFLVYSETRQPDNPKFINGNTIQCDGLNELIHHLRECIQTKKLNVIITTIQNGKPQ